MPCVLAVLCWGHPFMAVATPHQAPLLVPGSCVRHHICATYTCISVHTPHDDSSPPDTTLHTGSSMRIHSPSGPCPCMRPCPAWPGPCAGTAGAQMPALRWVPWRMGAPVMAVGTCTCRYLHGCLAMQLTPSAHSETKARHTQSRSCWLLRHDMLQHACGCLPCQQRCTAASCTYNTPSGTQADVTARRSWHVAHGPRVAARYAAAAQRLLGRRQPQTAMPTSS